jgi:hypothetical protein
MVVSHATAERIYEAFRRHLTAKQIRLLLDDLVQIPGSPSYRDSVNRLLSIHSLRAAKGKETEDGNK